MYKNFNRLFSLLTIIVLAVSLTACDSLSATKISNIYERTQDFQDKEITVKGRVETTVGLLGLSGFTINDGTGTLLVVGGGKTPSVDSKVVIKGIISVPVRFQNASIIVFNAKEIK